MITAMLVAIAVFYAWLMVAKVIWPPQPPATQPAESPAPTSQPSAPVEAYAVEAAGATTQPALPPIVLGSAAADSPYPMEIECQPRGASVSQVRIRGHYETVARKDPYIIIKPVTWTDQDGVTWHARSFVTHLQFLNPKLEVSLEGDAWKVVSHPPQKVEFSFDVQDGGRPLARVLKTYTLAPQTVKSCTSDMEMSLTIQNLTDKPVQVIVTQQGPIGFRREELRSEDRKVIGARWEQGKLVSKRVTRAELLKKKSSGNQANQEAKKSGSNGQKQATAAGVISLGRDDEEGDRIAWLAEGNKYFAGIMAPAGRENASCPALFERAEAFHFTNIPDDANDPDERQDLAFRYITKPIDLPGGGTDTLAFDVYVGPESKRIFESVPAYAKGEYYRVLSGEYPWCTPAPLVGLMMFLLNAFHSVWPHNYGIAIIVLVFMVKLLLHPISKKSQVNMQKMQKNQAKLKPRLDALKQKYGNDRAKLNQATMELYKEEGVNPAGQMLNCLPMMLQIPIWVALYTALAYTIEMRHAPFDGWWIKDLTRPDEFMKLFSEPRPIPLLSYLMGGPLQYLNLLPILLGIAQVLQTKFMPRGVSSAQAGASGAPDQLEQQRKMMMLMSVVFVFILYNAPSGLNLYIMVNNVLSVFEQWRIRKHLADLEASGASAAQEPGWLHKLMGRADQDRRDTKAEPREKSWLQRKWGDLQREVEDAKKVRSSRDKGKK